MTTYIAIPRTTGEDVLSQDQTGDMTQEQAVAVAQRFMDLFVARIQECYPDAEVEIIQGNGIDGLSVNDDDWKTENEITVHLNDVAFRLWESDSVWGVLA